RQRRQPGFGPRCIEGDGRRRGGGDGRCRQGAAGVVGVLVPRLVTPRRGHRVVPGEGGQGEEGGEVRRLPLRELLGDELFAQGGDGERPVLVHPQGPRPGGPGVRTIEIAIAVVVTRGEDHGDAGPAGVTTK